MFLVFSFFTDFFLENIILYDILYLQIVSFVFVFFHTYSIIEQVWKYIYIYI